MCKDLPLTSPLLVLGDDFTFLSWHSLVGWSVGGSVGRWVGRSVGRSVWLVGFVVAAILQYLYQTFTPPSFLCSWCLGCVWQGNTSVGISLWPGDLCLSFFYSSHLTQGEREGASCLALVTGLSSGERNLMSCQIQLRAPKSFIYHR